MWEAKVGKWVREQQHGWLCHGEEHRGQCGGGGPKLRLMDLKKSRGEGGAHEVRLRIRALRVLAERWPWLT